MSGLVSVLLSVRWTIQRILEQSLSRLLAKRKLPSYVHRALLAMVQCRTAALGSHVRKCPKGHYEGTWYNSCRHRSCPQCSMGKLEKWLAAKREMLLPGDHYHLIFTVPRQFRLLWQWNPRTFGDLLFTVSASTLRSLLGQERRLGDAKPGWIAALHTWGRTLIAHPHLHVLITGGGLLPDGTWRPVRNGYFLPFRQVRHVFRQRFCDALEAKLRAGELDLPEDLSLEKALRIVAKARRRKWNVRVEAPYRHGDGVATYLARYLKGGPIKNHRLVSFDGESVRFRYGDFREADASGKPKWKVLELSVEEFLRRLILHIPLPGMKMVRSYGLYAHTCRDQLEQARGQIEPSEEWLAARERFERAAEKRRADQPRCPICGLALVVVTDGDERSGVPPPAAVEVQAA